LQPPDEGSWRKLAHVNLLTLGGLLVALAVGAVLKLREGYRVTGRMVLFTLFLLLETPTLVYAGILGGIVAGMLWAYPPDGSPQLLIQCAAVGGALGLALGYVRYIEHRGVRLGSILLLGAALTATVFWWYYNPFAEEPTTKRNATFFAVQIL